jgi:hypothetical protein
MARVLLYKSKMLSKIRHIAILLILLMGAIGNVYAIEIGHNGLGYSIEKEAERQEGIKAWEVMIPKAYRTDVSLLQRMSDDIIEEPLFYTWIKNNPSKLDYWKIWQTTYNSLGDPVKSVLGSGRINHTTEWNQLISEIQAAGGEIKYSPGRIAYSPGLKKGEPGQLIIDQDASITALRHEHRHFLDDQIAGYKGFEGLYDINFRYTTEFNAYKLEVLAMKDLGHTNIVNQLKANFQEEINKIFIELSPYSGPPNQSSLNLVTELMNL